MSEYFVPVIGMVYRNHNGNQYLCIEVEVSGLPWASTATFRRIPDGWTLKAHGIMYRKSDDTIEWNYSTGGHWPDQQAD